MIIYALPILRRRFHISTGNIFKLQELQKGARCPHKHGGDYWSCFLLMNGTSSGFKSDICSRISQANRSHSARTT